MIKFPKAVDTVDFQDLKIKTTKYGLPIDVLYCKKCVISNQRPNSTIEFF